MEYLKINAKSPSKKAIDKALKVLKEGGTIIYPTDTLYGIGVDMFNDKALQKLFHLKQRKSSLAVSMLAYSIEQVEKLFGYISPDQVEDLSVLLPGKFTILVESRIKNLGLVSTNQKDKKQKIGFRIPDHKVCQELARRFGSPVSATSANISGKENVFTVADVVAQFGNRPDLILDAGPLEPTKGSTIIDLTKYPYLIRREGDISLKELSLMLPKRRFREQRNVFTVTFVCSGNICRSPIAAGILKDLLKRSKYNQLIKVNSAGTLKLAEGPAHENSIHVAIEKGIDITHHLSRPINDRIVEKADLLICMARDHYDFLRDRYPFAADKTILLKQWKRKTKLAQPSVSDPIGREMPFFREIYHEIYQEMKRIIPFLFAEVKKFIEYHEIALKE